MNRYRRLLPYAYRQWRGLLWIVVLTFLGSMAAALQPWPIKLLTDYALGTEPVPPAVRAFLDLIGIQPGRAAFIIGAAALCAGIFLANQLLNLGLTWSWASVGQRMVSNLARAIFHRLLRLPFRFHHRHPVGDSLSRLTTDTWCVYKLTDGVLIAPAQKVFTLLSVGVVAWHLNRELAFYAFATAPLMAAASFFFGKRLKRRTRLGREAQARLQTFVHQTLTAIPVVQVFAAEGRNAREYRRLAGDAVALSQRGTLLVSSYGMVSGLITTLGMALIVFVGGQQVLRGRLTLGSFLVFLAYLRIMQANSESLLRLYGSLKPLEASMDRVLEILEEDEDEVRDAPGAPALTRSAVGSSALALENVSFGYEPGRPVLRGVTLTVRPGEMVALAGATGAGKTSLVSLIPRLFDPWEGRVVVGGRDVRDVQVASLRSEIGMVLQEPFLFPLSIAENIALGRPGASLEEIIATAEAARADGFIRRLERGYETVLGERGMTLSGGERQRLAVARALLKDAPILILDEPTSALDAETEDEFLQALERLMEGRTTVLVAHRLSTVRRADRIVVMSHGRVAESGTHDELLAAGGIYHRYHDLQFSGLREEVAV